MLKQHIAGAVVLALSISALSVGSASANPEATSAAKLAKLEALAQQTTDKTTKNGIIISAADINKKAVNIINNTLVSTQKGYNSNTASTVRAILTSDDLHSLNTFIACSYHNGADYKGTVSPGFCS